METALLVLGFIIACAAGFACDYYKPARVRTSYRNANQRRNDGAEYLSDNDCGDDGGGD